MTPLSYVSDRVVWVAVEVLHHPTSIFPFVVPPSFYFVLDYFMHQIDRQEEEG